MTRRTGKTPGEPPGFEQFWNIWYEANQPHGRRAHYAQVAEYFLRLGAQRERNEMVQRGWIEPKPVTPPSPSRGSSQRWPFALQHDHEPQVMTGLSIPETP